MTLNSWEPLQEANCVIFHYLHSCKQRQDTASCQVQLRWADHLSQETQSAKLEKTIPVLKNLFPEILLSATSLKKHKSVLLTWSNDLKTWLTRSINTSQNGHAILLSSGTALKQLVGVCIEMYIRLYACLYVNVYIHRRVYVFIIWKQFCLSSQLWCSTLAA